MSETENTGKQRKDIFHNLIARFRRYGLPHHRAAVVKQRCVMRLRVHTRTRARSLSGVEALKKPGQEQEEKEPGKLSRE